MSGPSCEACCDNVAPQGGHRLEDPYTEQPHVLAGGASKRPGGVCCQIQEIQRISLGPGALILQSAEAFGTSAILGMLQSALARSCELLVMDIVLAKATYLSWILACRALQDQGKRAEATSSVPSFATVIGGNLGRPQHSRVHITC